MPSLGARRARRVFWAPPHFSRRRAADRSNWSAGAPCRTSARSFQSAHRGLVRPERGAARLDVVTLHAHYGDFVWATLQRLGVRPADLEDQLQEVFVVVHRRVETYDGSAPMSAWLYGVCRRVAAAYRDGGPFGARCRARRRSTRGRAGGPRAGRVVAAGEGSIADAPRRARPRQTGGVRDVRGRGDELQQIAEAIGVPVGTVYSRCTWRVRIFNALERHRKREARGTGRDEAHRGRRGPAVPLGGAAVRRMTEEERARTARFVAELAKRPARVARWGGYFEGVRRGGGGRRHRFFSRGRASRGGEREPGVNRGGGDEAERE